MRCPDCGSFQTIVVDSRLHDELSRRYRRYICGDCGSRFTSYEITKADLDAIEERHKDVLNRIIEMAQEGGGRCKR